MLIIPLYLVVTALSASFITKRKTDIRRTSTVLVISSILFFLFPLAFISITVYSSFDFISGVFLVVGMNVVCSLLYWVTRTDEETCVPIVILAVLPPLTVICLLLALGPLEDAGWVKDSVTRFDFVFGSSFITELKLTHLLVIFAGFLYLSDPANAFVKCLLNKYGIRPDEDEDNDELGRGALIGTLERWIVFLLILLSQYTAIAFVIAAKSIMRYKKIEEDPEFGEYFIAGTLASITVALFVGILVKFVTGF